MKFNSCTMNLHEFLQNGYLQEVNRIFFHPLGLALYVEVDGDKIKLGGIYDYRADPEGVVFTSAEECPKVDQLREEKAKVREQKFGWVVQPMGKLKL